MESLVGLKADLVLSCQQPMDVAGRTTLSDAKAFFESKPFDNWKKARDMDTKLQLAVIDRLNTVIEGLNVVARSRR